MQDRSDQQWQIVPESAPEKKMKLAKPCSDSLVIIPGQKYFIRNWHDALTLTLGNTRANKNATDEIYVRPHIQGKMDAVFENKVGQVVSCHFLAFFALY
jgi:hypothetical protein